MTLSLCRSGDDEFLISYAFEPTFLPVLALHYTTNIAGSHHTICAFGRVFRRIEHVWQSALMKYCDDSVIEVETWAHAQVACIRCEDAAVGAYLP